jgi:hypothetical protein
MGYQQRVALDLDLFKLLGLLLLFFFSVAFAFLRSEHYDR